MALLCLVFMMSGCDFLDEFEDDDEEEASGGEIWPLAVGNVWNYDFFGYNVTYKVIGTGTVSGDQVFRVQITGPNINEVNVLSNHSDGLYDYGMEPNTHSGELFLKYPTSVGDSWTYAGVTMTVISTSQSVSVPAGTFDCVVYEYNSASSGKNRYYFSPHIGYIQFYQGSSNTYNLKLKSYSLN